jgi:hypothetical protein
MTFDQILPISASSTPTRGFFTQCLVCEEGEAAKHYGSVCCSGCKGFFRRTVRFHKVYDCPFGKKCNIRKGSLQLSCMFFEIFQIIFKKKKRMLFTCIALQYT